jgi:transposase
LYLDRTGCAWRYLPADFPPWQTVYGYFGTWRDDGTLARLHHELRARAAAGRNPSMFALMTRRLAQTAQLSDTHQGFFRSEPAVLPRPAPEPPFRFLGEHVVHFPWPDRLA